MGRGPGMATATESLMHQILKLQAMKAKQPPLLFIATLLYYIPQIISDNFCGTNQTDAENTCWQPCSSDGDCCSRGQRCYEAGAACGSSLYEGTNQNYCGVSWCDAAYTCSTPCADGVCPDGLACWGNTPCDTGSANAPPPLPADPVYSNTAFCGASLDEAKETCWQPCPQGNDDCCLGLTCFNTAQSSSTSSLGQCSAADYSGGNHFYCGNSWCDAAYTCGEPCPGGSHEECTSGYCYADVPCTSSRSLPNVFPPTSSIGYSASNPTPSYKYCGVDPGDATDRCWQSCNSDSDCCFGQYCFDTGSNCGQASYYGTNHKYCGTTFCDATSKCSVACPNGTECPAGEICFDSTPCDSNISTNQPYYCGLSEAEAAGKCWQPCPGGQDSECCFGQTCYNTGFPCMQSEDPTVNHKFCGVDKCDADHKCLTPCPNGTECPSGESCFDNTPCSSTVAPPSFDFAYCGTSVADAVATCWQPCRSDSECCFGQTCYSSATACPAPNFQGSAHFFCGTDFCDASFRCNKPCPSGFNWECDIGESCYANTPCDADLSANSTMRYGLPDSKLNLVVQYVPSLPNQSSESSAHTLPNAKLIVLTILLIAGNL